METPKKKPDLVQFIITLCQRPSLNTNGKQDTVFVNIGISARVSFKLAACKFVRMDSIVHTAT